MSSEARLVIDRSPADPAKSGPGKLTQGRIDADAIKERRKQIHQQAKADAAGIGLDRDLTEAVPPPSREPIDSIEFTSPSGLTIEYGPPSGVSLSDRIARLYSTRSLAEGGPDPGLTEYRLTRLLMGVRSIDGKPVALHNLIDRTKLANRLGDEAIDLLNLFDNRHWPPLQASELPFCEKKYRT